MAQPSNIKLIEFIENSSVSLLTLAGVNNAFILLVEINNPEYTSKYISYNFHTQKSEPLTKLCIKVIYVSGAAKIVYGDKQSISIDLVKRESSNQNKLYKKSIKEYGSPICPPILSLNMSSGLRIDILSALLSRFKRDRINKPIAARISEFIKDKSKYPIGFVVMGYIPPHYKPLREWDTILANIGLAVAKQTYYFIFKQLFKLHYLGYQHCDLNPDNIMICNPYVIESTTKANSRYTSYGEVELFSMKTSKLKRAVKFDNPMFRNNPCIHIDAVLIDFGAMTTRAYDNKISIIENLKCEGEYELLLRLYMIYHDDTLENINIKIGELLDKDSIKIENHKNRPVDTIHTNDDPDKFDKIDIRLCKEYISRQNKIHSIVTEIGNKDELNEKVLQQLKALSTRTPLHMNVDSGGLFGNNNDFGGGSRTMSLYNYLKTLTYNFNKSARHTRKKH